MTSKSALGHQKDYKVTNIQDIHRIEGIRSPTFVGKVPMTSLILSALLVPVAGQISAFAPHQLTGMRSIALSADGQQLAFTYRGDIWIAPSAGGRAIPLTSNVEMDDNPVFSPDGKWIAFTSDRAGDNEIYAVSTEGGQPVRLTFNSTSEAPVSWTPDGKELIYDTSYDKGYSGIYALDVKSLRLREIFVNYHRMDFPYVSPDGKTIAFTHKQVFAWTRPRYEGSGAAQIWTIGIDGSARKMVRSSGLQHLWPQFAPNNKDIYAVTVTDKTPSSRRIDEKPARFTDSPERTPNVHRVAANGRATRLTNFVGGSGARFLSVASKAEMIAFERDGAVYTMVPGKEPQKVNFTASIDDKGVMEERLVITNGVEGASMTPDGKTAIIQIRRELWSVPTTRGKGPNGADATQLTNYAGTDSQPVASPDGKHIFFTSDRNGSLKLFKMNLETKQITVAHDTAEDVSNITVTPDKKHLAYQVTGKDRGLYTLPIEGGTAKLVIPKSDGAYAFSPDMKYVAYVKSLVNSGFKPWENTSNVWVREVATGNEVNVSRLNVVDGNPSWSADGKFLYFTSARSGGGIFMVPAQEEEANTTELELKYTKPEGAVTTNFKFEGAADRIRAFYRGAAFGQGLSDPEKGDLYFLVAGDIWRAGYDGEGARAITAGGGIFGMEFSADGNSINFIRRGTVESVDIRKPNFPTKTLEFRADWVRNITAERKAAFQEFYRVYNQTFYDEFFHRRDWKEIRDRHEPLLDGVAHRREMATVLNMMVGELEASHAEVGPAGGGVAGQSTAHLGFTIDFSYTGAGLRIKEVPRRTPGSFPKTQLKAGEYVMEVNGTPVSADQHLFKLLNNQAGRDITLTVNSTPSTTGARKVTYRAMSGGQFRGIQTENLEQWRREYVEKKSNGRITYVHIAGMGGGNLTQFNQEMWEYVQGKDAVIIDVRENGGGNIADILLDALERRLHMRYQWRNDDEIPGPGQVWGKPTVVMHAESSFSNAEMFPAAMKTLGLATLVGMPTPGYVIYTGGSQLVDGTSIRIPGGGVYRVDGTPLENMGEKPDIQIDLDPDDFFNGRDPQMDKAIEHLMKQLPRG